MPVDGVVVRNIVQELNDKVLNGRVDKITQPEVDEILINVRSSRENYKLFISSNPNYPRVHLTNMNKQSPISAPVFCMVLRKHLSGGRITKIEQYDLDRIIKIHIESYDELGCLSNKILLCEIMGRHSNIILVNENYEVIDSIKHITPDMSSFRQILPGLHYKYPPAQDKIEPLNFSMPEFLDRMEKASSPMKLGKFISSSLNGINIFAAREISYNAGLDENVLLSDINKAKVQDLTESIERFIQNVIMGSFSPSIYYNGPILYDFYCFDLDCLKNMRAENDNSISKIIELFYYSKDRHDRIKQKSSDVLKIVNTNLDRCVKKLSIQEQKLLECQERGKWKLYGDLIMANLYILHKGDTCTKVLNFYDEGQDFIDIPLDMLLSPVENAQRYYKKYNKEKSAIQIVESQKEENLYEISYLENQLVNIDNCTLEDEIEEIRNELISQGYIKKRKKTASRKLKPSSPMHYISSDGLDIYVGKNNVQNDYLTTKFAGPGDIWMHTKNIPGSHVIIKLDKKPVSESAIMEGASLAAYYSKARTSSNVPVDYTEKKNVKKPSGAKPGMVIYYTNRTSYVTPDENLIASIKVIE